MSRARVLFIAACACLMLAAPASASASTPPPISWSRIYNGPADGHDLNTRVAVDAAGNVFVAGRSPTIPGDYTDANNDIAVVKYSPQSRCPGVDEVQDIGVDSKGNVIIAGHTWTGLDTDGPDAVDDDPNDADYITLKYAPDGRLKWARSYNGPIDRDDFAFAMAIGPGNRIFVTGYSWWAQEFGVTPIRAGIATIAYSPNGTRLWVERRDSGEGDGARDIAVGPDGNVYLTGSTMVYDGGASQDVVPISYTPDGAERWTAAVLKYRPDGTLAWTQRYDRSRNDLLWDRHTSWSGRSMTLGADGFLYVSGQTVASGEDSDFVVFKMPRS